MTTTIRPTIATPRPVTNARCTTVPAIILSAPPWCYDARRPPVTASPRAISS
jgi:hypothetical protein